jgi:hypothetical protein
LARPVATERIIGAVECLNRAKDILREHDNYKRLTENYRFVAPNTGIEFAVTHFIIPLMPFFIGAGRYVSVHFWSAKRFKGE